MPDLDLIDRKIVAELMRDATLPIAMIADKVGLSQPPLLEAHPEAGGDGHPDRARGAGRSGQAGLRHLGLRRDRDTEPFPGMTRGVHPRCPATARGDGDLPHGRAHRQMLRMAVRDMPAYDDFYKWLTDAVAIKNVTSHFAMERIRFSTTYPVDTRNR